MNLEIDETRRQLRTAARDFLKKEHPVSLAREIETTTGGYSKELWQSMGELGWLRMIFPYEYGGEEATILDLAVLYEEMGRALLTSPHLTSIILSGLTILDAGNEEQKVFLMPKIGTGELIVTLAFEEPGNKWNGTSFSTLALDKGEGFIITGTKLFVPYAHVADYVICVASTGHNKTTKQNNSLFLIDSKSPGLTCSRLNGFLAEPLCEVTFNNVHIPYKNLIGELHTGWDCSSKSMQMATAMQCCEMVGGADRMLEITIDYSKQRKQFGQFIGSFHRIQDRILNMITELDKAGLATYEAILRLSEGLDSKLEVSTAKYLTNEAYTSICHEAHYVHAGIGFMTDYDLYLYTKKAKTLKNRLGNSTYHRKIIAEGILQLPL